MRKTSYFSLAILLCWAVNAFAWPSVYPTGTTIYEPDQAYNGYTLFSPMDGPKGADSMYKKPGATYLIDMNGNVVHSWKLPFPPGLHAMLLPNGHLLATGRTAEKRPGKIDYVGLGLDGCAGWLYELDWDGTIVFKYYDEGMHHDFTKLKNGNYMFVAFEMLPAKTVKKVRGGLEGTELKGGRMTCDKLVEVNPQGKVVWEWHAKDHMDFDIDILGPIHPRVEWLHVNDIDESATGDLIFSARHTDCVYVLDKKTGKVRSRFGNVSYLDTKSQKLKNHNTGSMLVCRKNLTLGGPHDAHEIAPGLPGAGHILVYDNGMYTDTSRALEFDSATGKVVWESTDFTIGRRHFSSFISSAERLPNGNTIICSGANGRFFETTPDNTIVWEYVSPYMPNKLFNYVVFRAHRYAPDYCSQFADLTPAKGTAVVPPENASFHVGDPLSNGSADEEDEEDDEGTTMNAY